MVCSRGDLVPERWRGAEWSRSPDAPIIIGVASDGEVVSFSDLEMRAAYASGAGEGLARLVLDRLRLHAECRPPLSKPAGTWTCRGPVSPVLLYDAPSSVRGDREKMSGVRIWRTPEGYRAEVVVCVEAEGTLEDVFAVITDDRLEEARQACRRMLDDALGDRWR